MRFWYEKTRGDEKIVRSISSPDRQCAKRTIKSFNEGQRNHPYDRWSYRLMDHSETANLSTHGFDANWR